MASFSKETIDGLRRCLPPIASIYNPVDTIADTGPERYRTALELVLKDDNVHSVITMLAPIALIDERDIASLLFYRASTQDDYQRYTDTGGTQEALNKAERFRRLERELGVQYSNLNKGIALYSKRRYGEAIEFFDEVLSFDRDNEEALYYWALAAGKNKPAAGGEAAGNE